MYSLQIEGITIIIMYIHKINNNGVLHVTTMHVHTDTYIQYVNTHIYTYIWH